MNIKDEIVVPIGIIIGLGTIISSMYIKNGIGMFIIFVFGLYLLILSVCKMIKLIGMDTLISTMNKIIKNKITIIIGIVIIFVILWKLPHIIFGFKQSFSKEATDILGYYGALIGSGVTVLGVYWTLNYESKKSKEDRENERQKEESKKKQERELLKEERRKNSLPILRFTFDPCPDLLKSKHEYTEESTTGLDSYYDILFNTSVKRSIKKGKIDQIKSGKTEVETERIYECGTLEIVNVGLGAAILSDVYLYRNDKEEIVNNLKVDAINKFIIPPGHTIKPKMFICSNDFSEDDYLCVDFIDLYSNSYRYEISFEKNFPSSDCKTKIHSEMVSVLPKLIDTDNA